MENIFKIKLNSDRIFGLDILRACAILFVVIEHGSFLLPEKLRPYNDLLGFDGVSIFFVLSGFLIGGILLKIFIKNKINKSLLFDFWIRRWFRTLPNYFLILIILVTLNVIFTPDFTFWSVKKYFIFSQNLFREHPGFFPEAWSLSIEEWFYLLIPIVIFFLIIILKISPRISVMLTACLIILLVTGFRFIRFESNAIENISIWDALFRKQVITRLDSLMFGVIGAYLSLFHPAKWLKFKKPLLLIGILLFLISKFLFPLFFPVGGIFFCVFSFSTISLATLFLLPFLSDLKRTKGVFYKFFTYISLISYSMYLLNLSVIQGWIINRINWDDIIGQHYLAVIIRYFVFWILTILLSILLYKYFEISMTKMRDKQKIKKFLNIIVRQKRN